ncbi:MAG: nuclear transport factor 2 family protein [Ferruginibacter sp.]
MKKITLLSVSFLCFVSFITAQVTTIADSNIIIKLNQQIDDLVVQKNTNALDDLYADDFVFSHGSGRIEGKQGWFKSVANGGFLLRQHDSVTVELHPDIAIVKGKLSVQKKNKDKTESYHLKYIRVYALRHQRWLMISHITFYEYHEPQSW